MWGYCIAAASLGIKHRVMDALQYEGGAIGNRERRLAWPNPNPDPDPNPNLNPKPKPNPSPDLRPHL